MTAISLCNVHKRYNAKALVINNINLEITQGEFCVFIGPSGCGKSTLLRMIAGLEEISGGELSIDGRLVNHLPPSERDVAMVFQSYALYPHMSVFENMAFGLRIAIKNEQEVQRRVAEAVRMLQLEPLLDYKPRQLSGGQRQRVAIGRAIVRQPKVFLFDEPLSNLDAGLRVQTRIELAHLHRKIGSATSIYVTHDQVEAMTLADQIVLLNAGPAVLKDGSVAQAGRPLELYHRPVNRFVAGFIGSPSMNFLPGTVAALDGSGVSVRLPGGDLVSARVSPAGLAVGQEVTIGIRPEHILLGHSGLGGKLAHVEHLGEHSYVYVHVAGVAQPLVYTHPSTFRQAPGVPLYLKLPPESLHLFVADGRAQRRLHVAELDA
ncbi:ABC transporter ATP-binding protein [Collimonas silvisoli]|uniref:ABC transporter ATP-binding protein n=1 Tax=Collimonas silvisoli TaxID=2825884 RepID=UPI001B8DA83E|nr:sn-glycerol-3-phosphate ABC transporter ATP-binding protein UgpC [Collimonas silvisoli]